MELNKEKEESIEKIVNALAMDNPSLKESPSTRVMATNLLQTYQWDVEKALEALGQ